MFGTHRGQKRASDLPELELHVVMNDHVGPRNQIQIIWKSLNPWPLSYLSSPRKYSFSVCLHFLVLHSGPGFVLLINIDTYIFQSCGMFLQESFGLGPWSPVMLTGLSASYLGSVDLASRQLDAVTTNQMRLAFWLAAEVGDECVLHILGF